MIKYVASVICVGLLAGCYQKAPKDILGERSKQEKVFSAIKNYDDLIGINKEKLKKKDSPDNRIALAQNYYDIGDYDSAEYYITPLIDANKDSRAFLIQGKILDAQEKYDEALEHAKRSIELDPKSPEPYNLAGVIYSHKKDYDEAKINFLKAKELFMQDKVVNNNLGMLSIANGDYQEAVQYLMPLYARGHKDGKIVFNLVLALVKSNQDSKAIEILSKENLARDPEVLVQNLKQMKKNENN